MNSISSAENRIPAKATGHNLRILVVTGASGGHIFPALVFLDTLKAQDNSVDILLVLPEKNVIYGLGNPSCQVKYISISSVKLSLDFKNIIAMLKLFKGSLESMFIILKFKPDAVVGFGSLSSMPMVLLAWLFRIKTLIHEQNVVPGRANRLLARFSDRIAVSFAQTQDHFKYCRAKTILTGNPIRKDLMPIAKDRARGFFGFSPDKFTILAMGGSLGSHRINLEFPKAISAIADTGHLQIIHLTGEADYELLTQRYKNLNVNIRLFRFLEHMQYAYSACDLAVSRAGATTIAEIIFFRVPAILLPYPYAYQHQLSNARVLEKSGSAVIVQEDQLPGGILQRRIEELIDNPDRLVAMRRSYDAIPRPTADILLVNEVLT